MRRLLLAFASVAAFAVLPACAAEHEEDVDSADQALEAEWGEMDEDATPITQAEKAVALGDDEDDKEVDGIADPDDDVAEPAAPTIIAPPPLPKSCNPASSLGRRGLHLRRLT